MVCLIAIAREHMISWQRVPDANATASGLPPSPHPASEPSFHNTRRAGYGLRFGALSPKISLSANWAACMPLMPWTPGPGAVDAEHK